MAQLEYHDKIQRSNKHFYQCDHFDRGTLVLYCYGKINETAQAMKNKLHMNFAANNRTIIAELNFFNSALDNLSITAGSFFACTKGIIFTILGALSTYVVVLVQSV